MGNPSKPKFWKKWKRKGSKPKMLGAGIIMLSLGLLGCTYIILKYRENRG